MDREKVIDKVKKVLNKCSNNPSQEEVIQALQLAQKIALKYGIDIETLQMEEGKYTEEDVSQERIDFGTESVSSKQVQMATLIADNFKCRILKIRRGGKSYLCMVGLPEDVKIAIEILNYTWTLYEALFKKFLSNRKKSVKLTRRDSLLLKNDYFFGFIEGVREGLTANVKEFGLVVVTPNAVIQSLSKYKEIGIRSSLMVEGDAEAFYTGKRDGEFSQERERKICNG